MRFLILLFLSLVIVHAEDNSYQLGQGVQVYKLPLYLGGYTSLEYKKDQQSQSFSVGDVALMLYGSKNRFSYMAELEYKDLYVKKNTDTDDYVRQDRNVYVERVYVDYTSSENVVIRLGKYNSPIGYWNMLPINVLRETTSSPKEKEVIFPEFTTGVGISYSSYGDAEIKYDFMGQNNPDLDDKYNSYEIDRHFGAGVTYTKNEFSLKANGGYFHQTEKELQERDRYYLLVGFKYEIDQWKFMGEAGTQMAYKRFTTPYALYLQSVYAFNQEHSINLRLEAYKDNVVQSSSAHDDDEDEEEEEDDDDDEYEYRDVSQNDVAAIIGYTYRPAYPVALKFEYQFHTLQEQDKFLASFSVLF